MNRLPTRYAKLTVIGRAPARGRYKLMRCRCECGGEIVVRERHLESGAVTSCGCGQHRQKNLAGLVVDGLKIVGMAQPIDGAAAVVAECQTCRRRLVIKRGELLLGAGELCGCAGGIHEPQYHPELKATWLGMLARCRVGETDGREGYAGRGITVCEGWRNSFERFVADMGAPPAEDLSIDRINNDGHYSCGGCDECKARNWPANCRWATRSEQARNRRPARRRKDTA